jgi:hypothetical protein
MSIRGRAGVWAGVRRSAAELTPETIEQIAHCVAQLLQRGESPRGGATVETRQLLDAAQLARRLGVTRAWVYEHAAELGAVALGDGPKARLRFDPAIAVQMLQARRRGGVAPSSTPDRTRARRRRQPAAADVPLLPVHSPRSRGIFARVLRTVRRP